MEGSILYFFLAGVLLIAISIRDLLLLATNPFLGIYPNLKLKLSGDFWTFLLNPEVKDKQSTY